MEAKKTSICPACVEGKAKTGRPCPACKGEVKITDERYEEICKGMAQVENINKKRGWFGG